MTNETFERGDVVTYRAPAIANGIGSPRIARLLAFDLDNQVFVVRNMAGTIERVSVFEVQKVLPKR